MTAAAPQEARVVAEGVGFSPPPLPAPLREAPSPQRRRPNCVRIPLNRHDEGTRTLTGPRSSVAEGVGFEPTGHLCPLVFKTRSIGRSDNPPDRPSLPSRAPAHRARPRSPNAANAHVPVESTRYGRPDRGRSTRSCAFAPHPRPSGTPLDPIVCFRTPPPPHGHTARPDRVLSHPTPAPRAHHATRSCAFAPHPRPTGTPHDRIVCFEPRCSPPPSPARHDPPFTAL